MQSANDQSLLSWFKQQLRIPLTISAGMLMNAAIAQPVYAAESRSYVIGWFSNAASSENGDCIGGTNPSWDEQYRRNLALLGKNEQEIDRLMRGYLIDGEASTEVRDLMLYRGRLNGEPVNAYAHPWAVEDPQLKSVEGKHAFGFNLNGQIDDNSFEDPVTGEQGIDHQLFRAFGCIEPYRGTMQNDPTYWTWVWTMMKDSMPAWVITIIGNDLDSDGDVTIRMDRALEHVTFNNNGDARSHVTYRLDPDPRSQNEFPGKIENGVISITQPGNLMLLKDSLSFPEFALQHTHMRLKVNEEALMEGLIGGYQPWEDIYFAMAQMSISGETMVTGDIPGMYYLLQRNADFDPDPETGQNRSISATYRITAVPAFFSSIEIAAE